MFLVNEIVYLNELKKELEKIKKIQRIKKVSDTFYNMNQSNKPNNTEEELFKDYLEEASNQLLKKN